MRPTEALRSRLEGAHDGRRVVEGPLRILRRAAPRPRARLRSLAPGLAAGGIAALVADRRRFRLGRAELRYPAMTPLGALVRGLAAGLAGNAAMDLTQMTMYKLRGKETGQWESWDEAPAPAQIGKRMWEGVFQREAPPEKIELFNNVVHWTYGPALAGMYGLVEASLARRRPLRDGTVFGIAIWILGSGVLVPAAKLAKPPWGYGLKTNALDISYHLAHGLATAGAFRALERI